MLTPSCCDRLTLRVVLLKVSPLVVEQSLESLRPSTRRVYVAGAKAAIRAAGLELWQSHSSNELLASIGKSPPKRGARISPFLDFLGGIRPKKSVPDEDFGPTVRSDA